jgi:rSAM/selenodomain-associated transferase 2
MISVIIPCLNEENNLPVLLGQLIEQENISLEILVADGGSTDQTALRAKQYGARVVHSQRGRGCQQNAGAAAATGEHLLFLHADSRLENNCQLSQSLSWIQQAEKRTAGHFELNFETDSHEVRARLRLFEYKSRLNREGTFSGDQGLLICKSDFKLMGEFSEKYHFLEDKEFANRFIEYGQFKTLPSKLYTSARRFEQEGLEERLILNTLIMEMFHLESEYFFKRAGEAYRNNESDGKLNLLPFFQLTHESFFYQGVPKGLISFFLLGRYATRNLWQVALPFHMKVNAVDRWLSSYDRFLRPLTDNLAGHLLGTLTALIWFYSWRCKLALKQRFNKHI